MDLSFLRLPPAPDLSPQVADFWFMRGLGPLAMPEGHRILPDGCMEFVFQLGDPFLELQREGTWRMQPHLLFVGQMERRVDIRPAGLIHTVGVHFRPAGAASFVPGDLRRFAHQILPLEQAIAEDLAPLVARLRAARTPDGKRVLIESFLRRRRIPGDDTMASVAAQLSAEAGPSDLEGLARRLQISDRQLRRRFEAAVGLGPKRFARIVRFQRVFEQSREEDARAWSEVALECGYYDQAHFNRDFRAFTGVRPRDIIKDADPLTAFFLSVSSKTALANRR